MDFVYHRTFVDLVTKGGNRIATFLSSVSPWGETETIKNDRSNIKIDFIRHFNLINGKKD